jgi:hypothetical protein
MGIQSETQAERFTDADIERVAREEVVHPRTLVRALAGLPVRGLAGDRALRAVAKLRGVTGGE